MNRTPYIFAEDVTDIPTSTRANGDPRRLTRLQVHYLERLATLRQAMGRWNSMDPGLRRVACRAIVSTWRDCAETGVLDEAKAILTWDRPLRLRRDPARAAGASQVRLGPR